MKFIVISQLVVGILLTVSILLQNKEGGLSAASGSDFGGYHTKRGIEKFLFYASVVLAVIFIVLAILSSKVTGV